MHTEFWGSPVRRRSLGRPGERWTANIKMDVGDRGFDGTGKIRVGSNISVLVVIFSICQCACVRVCKQCVDTHRLACFSCNQVSLREFVILQ